MGEALLQSGRPIFYSLCEWWVKLVIMFLNHEWVYLLW